MYYNSKNGAVKIWGGYLLENISQALSCVLLKQQFLEMLDTLDPIRIAATTHDEGVIVANDRDVERFADAVKRIMSTTRPWCEGLPLNADVKTSKVYSKV